MSFVLFGASLLAIVGFAMAVNRLTGTKPCYLDALQLAAGEKELWRDTGADFAVVAKTGRAAFQSYARLRRHTVVWTNLRIVIAQKPLLSEQKMITHQLYFAPAGSADGAAAARERFGGFYGRGFTTIVAKTKSFGQVNDKPCVRIKPTADSGANLNIDELLIFTDQLTALEHSLPASE